MSIVSVNLTNVTGPATQRAQGFLWSLSNDAPPDVLLAPLKSKLQRGRLTPWDEANTTGLPSYARLVKLGATVQVQVGGEYAALFGGYKSITTWPGDGGNWSLWDSVVEGCVARVRAAGLPLSAVQWDIWEEPNFKGWWNASRAAYFGAWARAVRTLRSKAPGTGIVGPSINK